jgi:hypothetical protein
MGATTITEAVPVVSAVTGTVTTTIMPTVTTTIMTTVTTTTGIMTGSCKEVHMARKNILVFIIFMSISAGTALGQQVHPTWVPTPEERADRPWIPTPGDALIGPQGVSMSIGWILLARKGSNYCAMKFTNTWLGETKYDHYTSYEYHYQGDGSGDFSKQNVKSGAGELFFPRVQGWMGVPMIKGAKDTIECGIMKFKWFYPASVGSRDFEFAPTPWTSITEVNVHDPRIKWYRYDKNRQRTTVHIDQL